MNRELKSMNYGELAISQVMLYLSRLELAVSNNDSGQANKERELQNTPGNYEKSLYDLRKRESLGKMIGNNRIDL